MTIVDCVHDYFLHLIFFFFFFLSCHLLFLDVIFYFFFSRLSEINEQHSKKRALEEKRLKQDQPMDEMPMVRE